MCFPFSPGKRETHKQFDPHPFLGQSREFVYVYWVFFSPEERACDPHIWPWTGRKEANDEKHKREEQIKVFCDTWRERQRWSFLLLSAGRCHDICRESQKGGTCPQVSTIAYLGGRFGPEKKYLAPSPAIPQFAADTLPALRPFPLLETPPVGFSIKNPPPPLLAPRTPPPPRPEQKKIKNIRNVHNCLQVSSFCDEDSLYRRARKATNENNYGRLCTSCRVWP